jgi:hypothetical protein
VKSEKRATRFSVESGATRSDHVIDSPLEIPIEMELWGKDAQEAYDALEKIFKDRTLVTIETRVGMYTDMLLEAMPHTETTSNFGGATINARFLQWVEVVPEYGELLPTQVKDKEHGKTKKSAEKAEEVPERKRSALHKMFGTEP